jgi:hypothetical protein
MSLVELLLNRIDSMLKGTSGSGWWPAGSLFLLLLLVFITDAPIL